MTIPPEFLDLLVHPVYKTPLRQVPGEDVLMDKEHQDRFDIRENVPILLTGQTPADLNVTDRHREAGTAFNYKEHYQNDAVAYDYTEESENAVEQEEINRLRQTILSQIPPTAEWILDVGCGGAWLARALVPKKRRVISMDISDINPIKALKHTPSPFHNALVADVFELPIKANSIDCIIASEVIEHVSDPKAFLAELFKLLKPGGSLIVTTPYNEKIRTSLCIHCNRLTPQNAHLHSFTEQSMQQYLPANAGRVTMKVFNSKLMVKAHVQKLFSFLPLSVWDPIDNIGSAITGKKAYRLMVVIEK
jgi:2-polyprenyl-3-methyl-5-hydroxy-6-metoxy-1,4-benzoquinol methylase/uncharacterized protein YbaR (Trm112 family)